jgi:hypothetical protein
MKRYFFLTDDLDDLRDVQQELLSAGITTPQIHVLSYHDAEVQERQLHEIEAVLKKDVVHGTEVGAVIGVLCAIGVLMLSWMTGISEAYTWTPAIFLAVVVLGFCTWEGGLIGIGSKHVDFQRFEQDLQQGRHVLLVDIDPEQKDALDKVTAWHPNLANAGSGKATPKPVVEFQNKWARFMELAP